MENERSQIGELFRKTFEDYQPEPSEAVWEKIAQNPAMNPSLKVKSWTSSRYFIFSGVSLLVIIGGIWLFSHLSQPARNKQVDKASPTQPLQTNADRSTQHPANQVTESFTKPVTDLNTSSKTSQTTQQRMLNETNNPVTNIPSKASSLTQDLSKKVPLTNTLAVPGTQGNNTPSLSSNSSSSNTNTSNIRSGNPVTSHNVAGPDNHPKNGLDIIENQKLCKGESIELWASGGTTYEWSTGESTSTITVNPSNTTTYFITITDHTGQPSYASVVVEVLECQSIYIPKAFNPYSDVTNNTRFRAYGTDIADFTMRIFSRTGQMVYESNDINEGWDGMIGGKHGEMGVYIYQVTYTDVTGKKKTVTGQLTLIK